MRRTLAALTAPWRLRQSLRALQLLSPCRRADVSGHESYAKQLVSCIYTCCGGKWQKAVCSCFCTHTILPPASPSLPAAPCRKKKKSTVMSETADQAHSDSYINSHSSISGTHLHGTVRLCSSRRGGKSPHQTDNSESAVMIFPQCASYASYRECSRGQQRAVGPPFLLCIRFWLPTFVFCLTPFS